MMDCGEHIGTSLALDPPHAWPGSSPAMTGELFSVKFIPGHIDFNLGLCTLHLSCPGAEGRSRLKTRGGMRWLARGAGDAAQTPSSAVKPRRPGAPAVRQWGHRFRDGGLIGSLKSRRKPRSGGEAVVLTAMPERPDHRGRRSEDLKHRTRDAMEFWRTCGFRTSACLDAARHRGPWVFQDPGVPRALGFWRERRKSGCDEGLPRADTKNTGDLARPLCPGRSAACQ